MADGPDGKGEDDRRGRTIAARLPLEEAFAAVGPAAPAAGAGRLSAVHSVFRRVTIGRAPENDVVVDDMLVSRQHAELHGDPVDGYELVDLGSHNGTFVNGERIRGKARIEQLDVVAVGRAQFRLVDDTLEEYVDTGEITFEARNITVRTGARTLVDGVGLSLRERSLVGIVGPSGCGKSTLLHALSGRRPATSGVVLYDGRDLYAHYDELRRRIGFVPQDDVLHEELRVSRMLEYAAELAFPPDVSRAERSGRVDEVLRELALEERRDQRIDSLSGGQRKRVSVAVELLTKPSLLFLDEPTSGLDPGYERTLMELLRALADGGRTVIVVTHSVQSLRLCDRVLALAPGGRIAYFGPAQLAPAYFGREDFQQVFQDLSTRSDVDWAERFRTHPEHDRYAGAPAVEAAPQIADDLAPASPRQAAARARRTWLRQFRTLCRRNVAQLVGDRRNLALLVLQAPALGLVMLLALPAGQLSPPADGTLRIAAKGGFVLLTLVMAATWLGASNAAREIVRELPIFRRERSIGLSITAYLGSKVLVLGAVTVLQAVVLVALGAALQGGPVDAVALGSPWLELTVAVAAAGIAAMGLGLLVSALAGRLERAMTILPVLIIVEMILAMGGVFPEMVSKPGLKQLSYVASTQWGFSAAASTAGLNDIEPLNGLARAVPTLDLANPAAATRGLAAALRGEPRWDHTASAWGLSMLALAGISLATITGAGLALRRYDPHRR
ncbi:MAG TPA: ATP-binding cassette domain-containing protein [Gaiellaceae bacterium]